MSEGKQARSLAQRLGALERTTGRVPADAVGPASEFSHAMGTGAPALDSDMDAGDTGLAALGFLREDAGFGPVWHRELRTDVLSRYGGIQFAALYDIDLTPVARACKPRRVAGAPVVKMAADVGADLGAGSDPHAAPASGTSSGIWQRDPANLRFYDTETTGLGTAAGTFPFLHAVGQLTGDEWVVHQYFVAAYEEELAVLQTLAARHFDSDAVVVSFNGRTFDWPLLLNRFILYRLPAPSPMAHFDLLHPSRRLWKRALGGASLGRLEAGILGAARTDDLPGKEAPARYFRYVADLEAAPLGPVFNHNAADVSALAALLVVLAEVLSGRRPAESAGEYAALAKWYDEWQETELAERCLIQATDCPDTTWREFWLQSLYYKRHRRYGEASKVWLDMTARYPTSLPPLVELAKYAEHHLADFTQAHQYTTTAMACRQQVARALRDTVVVDEDRVLAQLRHRLQRIERKQATGASAANLASFDVT